MKKYTSQHILSQCSVLFAFIVIFQSCYPWFLWGDILVGNISIMLFLVCRILLRSKISNRYRLPAFFLFLFYLWMGIYQAEQLQTPVVQLIKRILPLFFIVSMQKEEKVRLKDLTINIISLILFISFVAYVFIIFLEFPLQPMEIRHPINTWYPPFLNYYFFITAYGDFLRFHSIFTEPGHLGMFCALLLYINRYSMKDFRNVIMLISLIFSFSLAAYVLLVAGWFIYELIPEISFRKISKMSLVIVLFVCVGWCYLSYSPDGIIQNLIINRLAYDEEKGVQGNNRNTYDFMQTYDKLSTSEYLVGKRTNFMNEKFANTANSSYRNFIMANGFIGLSLLFLFFLSVIYAFPSRLAFGMFLLFIMSFWQRPYWLLEIESWVFLCAVSIFYYDKNI